MKTCSLHCASKQSGFVLLMSLIMLILLTVLALAAVSTNTSQTRVVANGTDTEITFETAEGAMNQAINNLLNGTYLPTSFQNNSGGLYQFNANNPPLWTTINWASTGAVINGFQGSSKTQASYIIEKLPSVLMPGQNMKSPTNVYRITTRAVGASGNTALILQATVQLQQ
jgi:type IV pilus assembly protein PilX